MELKKGMDFYLIKINKLNIEDNFKIIYSTD